MFMIKFLISAFFLIFTVSSYGALSGYYNSLNKFKAVLDSQELPKTVNSHALESIIETKELTFLITYGNNSQCSVFATLDMSKPQSSRGFVGGSISYKLNKISAPNCKGGSAESLNDSTQSCQDNAKTKSSSDSMVCEKKDDELSIKFTKSLENIRRVLWEPKLADNIKQLPIESIRDTGDQSYLITYRGGDCMLYVTLSNQDQKGKDEKAVKIGSSTCSS